jgi:hypothetical protein
MIRKRAIISFDLYHVEGREIAIQVLINEEEKKFCHTDLILNLSNGE